MPVTVSLLSPAVGPNMKSTKRQILFETDAIKKKIAERRRRLPRIVYPPALPILERKEAIVEAIRQHQVVVITGETGSGKTTQIPKMCIEAGRGLTGLIGCTQPRRIAATTVARRIAEELGEELGRSVGYKIRFDDTNPAGRLLQDHDRRDPPHGGPARPAASRLRHDHRRRGARAEPQHRFHPRHPEGPPHPAARPARHHHLGDHRHREILEGLRRCPRSSRCRDGSSPSRSAISPLDPGLEEKGEITHVEAAVRAVDEIDRKARAGGHPDLHADGAGHPRDLQPPRRPVPGRGGDPPPLLAPHHGRAAAGLPAARGSGRSSSRRTWPRLRSRSPGSGT